MKHYDIEKIRTIAVMGPQGSGKTSFMESVLHVTGLKSTKGKVEDGTTVSDYLDEEKAHQSSMSMSLIPVEYEGFKFNFLDIPGNKEFVNDLNQALSVVKGAIVIVDGQRGIDVLTQQILQDLSDKNIPTFIFVNKMDKENVKYDVLLEGIKKIIGNKAVPFLQPIVENGDFRGYINLVEMKTRVLDGGKVVDKPIPDELMSLAEEPRENIVESVAMSSEALLEKLWWRRNHV